MHLRPDRANLCLGCLKATPLISEAAMVNPDFTVAPSLDLWQTGLTTTGFRTVRKQISCIDSYMHIHINKTNKEQGLPEVQIVRHSCRIRNTPRPPGQARGCSGTVGETKSDSNICAQVRVVFKINNTITKICFKLMYLFRQKGRLTHGGIPTRSNIQYAITHLYENTGKSLYHLLQTYK